MVSDLNAGKNKAFSIRRRTHLPRPHTGTNRRILKEHDSQSPKPRYETRFLERNKKRSLPPEINQRIRENRATKIK